MRLADVDRSGHELSATPPDDVANPTLSHDGQRIAVVRTLAQTGLSNLWIRDVARNTLTRLTTSRMRESDPTWSPDDGRIAFSSAEPDGRKHFFIMPSSGGDATEFMPPQRKPSPVFWLRIQQLQTSIRS